jgi:hypothetical protein
LPAPSGLASQGQLCQGKWKQNIDRTWWPPSLVTGLDLHTACGQQRHGQIQIARQQGGHVARQTLPSTAGPEWLWEPKCVYSHLRSNYGGSSESPFLGVLWTGFCHSNQFPRQGLETACFWTPARKAHRPAALAFIGWGDTSRLASYFLAPLLRGVFSNCLFCGAISDWLYSMFMFHKDLLALRAFPEVEGLVQIHMTGLERL